MCFILISVNVWGNFSFSLRFSNNIQVNILFCVNEQKRFQNKKKWFTKITFLRPHRITESVLSLHKCALYVFRASFLKYKKKKTTVIINIAIFILQVLLFKKSEQCYNQTNSLSWVRNRCFNITAYNKTSLMRLNMEWPTTRSQKRSFHQSSHICRLS